MQDRWMKVLDHCYDLLESGALTEQDKEALHRKMRKEWYKRDHPVRQQKNPEALVRQSFVRQSENGESWTLLILLDRSKIRLGDVAYFLENEMHIDLHGHRINSMYDCTGRQFSHTADVRIFKDRIAVWQWQGLDV